MKKRICFLLCFIMLLTACVPDGTQPAPTPQTPAAVLSVPYTKVSVPYPQWSDLNWEDMTRTALYFADTGTVIPLSTYTDGFFWATIPQTDAERPLEVRTAEAFTFADNDESIWQYWTMEQAVYAGILPMPQDGIAAPMEKMSRQDAVECLLRLMGLHGDDDWQAAKTYGLTTDIPVFTPEGTITRQELVTLSARALSLAGLAVIPPATRESVVGTWELQDADAIADYALDAYGLLDTSAPVDYQETGALDADGIPVSLPFANPQNTMLRWEVVQFLDRIRSDWQLYPTQTAIEYGFDKAMPVIDGSTSTYPFTEAVYRNLFHNGYTHSSKPEKHSKSHASYQRLINGEVDMIFASVYPHKDILQMAEDAGVELELIPIAYDAMVFFTNSENSIDGLTTEQITNIYVSDAYENWSELGGPDAPFVPYCRNNDSGSHSQMERHFLGDNPIHENILPETSRSMSDILTDVMDVPYNTPGAYALGYSIYYYYHNMDAFYGTLSQLKLLKINGVAPTDETIASGEYPLSNNTYIALRKDTPQDHPARKMAAYMLTEAGQYCVLEAGFGPLDPNVKHGW